MTEPVLYARTVLVAVTVALCAYELAPQHLTALAVPVVRTRRVRRDAEVPPTVAALDCTALLARGGAQP